MVFEEVNTVEAFVAAPALVLFLRVHCQMCVKRFFVGKSSLTLGTGLQVVHVYNVVTEGKVGLVGFLPY